MNTPIKFTTAEEAVKVIVHSQNAYIEKYCK